MASEILKIDDIDREIINLVQENPSYTHSQIATKVDRSQPTVGMRIKKLEQSGLLKFQAGINVKSAELYFARVEIKTKNPEYILLQVQRCPQLLNAFRLDGDVNVSVLIAGIRLEDLDKIVNHHFRCDPEVLEVNMNLITEVAKDLVLPLPSISHECICFKENCSSNSTFEQSLAGENYHDLQDAKIKV